MSERAQQKDWDQRGLVGVCDGERGRGWTDQVQTPETLSRVGEEYHGRVGKIRAVGKTEALQPLEAGHAPALETLVGDGCASSEIDVFQPLRGMCGQVTHSPVGDMFAIAQC